MANDAYRNRFSTHFAETFYSQFEKSSNDQFHLFIGKVSPWSNENSPDASTDSTYHSNYSWRNALVLKKIDESDLCFVVPRYDWTSGTVYSQYDDDTDLFSTTTKFYVLTEDNNVYKCIYNNANSQSTTKPEGTGSEILTTDDGYRWKFLYTLSERLDRFMTKEWLPVEYIKDESQPDDERSRQWTVQTSSVKGSIDEVRISTTGDSVYSSATLQSRIIGERMGAQNQKGQNQVVLNSAASSIDDTYNNYVLYIDGGRGNEIGQVKRIVDYDGSSRIATLRENLDVDLSDVETTYLILPEIIVSGDGVGSKIVPTMNSNKTIKDLKILDIGRDYQYATATIATSRSSGSTDSEIDLQISPYDGHGSNPIKELEASNILISLKTHGDESGEFEVNNDFRQFGIIKNPIIATGPNEGTIAGTEFDRITELVITKPYNIMDSDYDYSNDTGNFKVNDYVLGSSTLSAARVVDWKQSGDGDGLLQVTDIKGGFSGPNTEKNIIRVNVDDSLGSGNFTIGETVTQESGGTANTAVGRVKTWDNSINELIIEVRENSFSGTTGGITGADSGAGYGPPFFDFGPEGGELVKKFNSGSTGFFSLQTIAGNTQDYGRIKSINKLVDYYDKNPVYDQRHKLTVSGSALSTSTFSTDAGFTQQDGGSTTGTLTKTTADIVNWEYTSGTTGALYLTNVVGSWTGGSYVGGGENTITKIEVPELVVGSGEVIYIQNIRPIKRNLEQREEFKILIGF